MSHAIANISATLTQILNEGEDRHESSYFISVVGGSWNKEETSSLSEERLSQKVEDRKFILLRLFK